MNGSGLAIDRLRDAFASLESAGYGTASCPPPERIWDAVLGELSTDECRKVVLHVGGCPSCAADWRLAARERVAPRIARPGRSWLAFAAIAASLVLAAGVTAVIWKADPWPSGETRRTAEEIEIRSLLPDDRALSRSDAVLRWTAVGEDALYSVEIGLEDLTLLDAAHDLRDTEYRIPAESLGPVEPGGTIVWRVEASLPDGRRIASNAFLTRVE